MPSSPRPAAGDPSTRTRAYQLGALLVSAAAIAAVLIAVLASGGSPHLVPGKPVPGERETLALLAGIPQRGIALGNPDAPGVLVEFGDLQCPACAEFATGALPSVIERYVRSGHLLLEFRALDFIGPDSRRAATMAAALSEQDRMWQFLELAYRNQGLENSGYVSDNYLRALADAVPGADAARALAARSSPRVLAQLDEARALARRAGVTATPSFGLSRGGGPLKRLSPSGLDAASFEHALDAALAAA
jgi:protein-disulfide isomerase